MRTVARAEPAAEIAGLPERDDHGYGVAAVCAVLGLDAKDWMLPTL